jgi:hypothetical protein
MAVSPQLLGNDSHPGIGVVVLLPGNRPLYVQYPVALKLRNVVGLPDVLVVFRR